MTMNMRDDIELTVLAEYGDLQMAEAVGIAIDYTWRALCDLTGIDPEALRIDLP